MFANNTARSSRKRKVNRQKMSSRNSNSKSNGGKKSYRSSNYREVYFRRNKGLFGKIHFCYYCGKPLLKKYVEVDHIMAVSKSRINAEFNLAASCRKCNRSKSDKVNHLVAVGFARKTVSKVIGIPFLILGVAFTIFSKLPTKGKFITIGVLVLAYLFFTSGDTSAFR